MSGRFQAVIEGEEAESPGSRVSFIEVPAAVVEALGMGKRPPLLVTVNGHSWRSRIAVYGGHFYLPVTKQNRAASGVELDDRVEVEIELDRAPREVDLPKPLVRALAADPAARAAFDRLSFTARREHADAVASAKQPATRDRRLAAILDALRKSGT